LLATRLISQRGYGKLNEPKAYRNSTVSAWLAAEDYEIPSVDTSAYSQARKRLPEKMLQRLFGQYYLKT